MSPYRERAPEITDNDTLSPQDKKSLRVGLIGVASKISEIASAAGKLTHSMNMSLIQFEETYKLRGVEIETHRHVMNELADIHVRLTDLAGFVARGGSGL